MNDKTTIYRRAMIDGSVIVVSILMAFSIDALWAQYQLRIEEKETLASLRLDFVANLEAVNKVIDAHILFRGRVATLISLSPEEIWALSQTEVSELMLSTANPWTFDAVLGTTDSLVHGGKMSVLRDDKLRNALMTFLNRLEDTVEDTNYLARGAEELWKAETSHGGPWTDPATEIGSHGDIRDLTFIPKATPEDLLNVRSDPEIMGHSKRFHINVGYYIAELEHIRTSIERILELVDEST